MAPTLNGIDHVHVYVANWGEAEKWYESVLGFRRVEKFMVRRGVLSESRMR